MRRGERLVRVWWHDIAIEKQLAETPEVSRELEDVLEQVRVKKPTRHSQAASHPWKKARFKPESEWRGEERDEVFGG